MNNAKNLELQTGIEILMEHNFYFLPFPGAFIIQKYFMLAFTGISSCE